MATMKDETFAYFFFNGSLLLASEHQLITKSTLWIRYHCFTFPFGMQHFLALFFFFCGMRETVVGFFVCFFACCYFGVLSGLVCSPCPHSGLALSLMPSNNAKTKDFSTTSSIIQQTHPKSSQLL